jgi:LacI family transcriptional regulator
VTIREVALLAGVAISSVSRVLSRHPDVSASMRSRVEQAVAELNYQPDLLAQALRAGSTRTVGFLLRDISNPLFANVAQRCEQVLRMAGYSMVITTSSGEAEVEAGNLELLRRRRVDGMIVSLVSETAESTLTALREFSGPIVLFDRSVPDLVAGAVLCDHYTGVYQATEALIARGNARIGLITGSLDVRSSRERRRGYVEALESAGIEADSDLMVFGEFEADFAKSEAMRLLSRKPSVTALLTGGFGSTAGALRAMRQLRLEPGADVAVVALDEWPTSDVFAPWLASVKRDSYDMGNAAAQLLLDMLSGAAPRTEIIDTTFFARDSLGPRRPSSRPAPVRAATT